MVWSIQRNMGYPASKESGRVCALFERNSFLLDNNHSSLKRINI